MANNVEDMEDQTKSNFIQFLRLERMNNRTLDFKEVIKAVEPLSFSHALLILNKKQLVSKLLGFLGPQDQNGEESSHGPVV
jgi:hypothetical protein